MPARTHGHKSAGERTRAYTVWMNMKSRCRNPRNKSFSDYGARGIAYDPGWERFESFLADMGEPPEAMTLERINNDVGYSKGNCVWASRSVQAINKRNCVRHDFNGQSKTLAEWSRELGIGRVTLLKRLQRGEPIERAFTAKGYLCASRGNFRMPTNDQTTGLLRLT